MVKKLRGALEFIHHEASGGVILLIAAVFALILANSPLAFLYGALLDTPVSIRIGASSSIRTCCTGSTMA